MNELIIKSFLINTYSLICLLPKEIENISISVKKITHDDLFNKTLVDIKNFSPMQLDAKPNRREKSVQKTRWAPLPPPLVVFAKKLGTRIWQYSSG